MKWADLFIASTFVYSYVGFILIKNNPSLLKVRK